MSIKQINSLIFSTDLTNDELTSIQDAIRFKRAQLTNQIRFTIKRGDNVEFTSYNTGRTIRGVVTKVAIKYATVESTGMGLYKVPMNMLSLVKETV